MKKKFRVRYLSYLLKLRFVGVRKGNLTVTMCYLLVRGNQGGRVPKSNRPVFYHLDSDLGTEQDINLFFCFWCFETK